MKKFFQILTLCLLSVETYAQLEISERLIPHTKPGLNINLYKEKKINDKFSLTGFLLVEKLWSEALVGFSYAPSASFSVGLSTGLEHGQDAPRFGASIWTGKGKISLLALLEKGKGEDNYWYKITATDKLSENFSLGLRAWRFHGVGPLATLKFKELDSIIWIMPAYDFEATEKERGRLIVGVSINI